MKRAAICVALILMLWPALEETAMAADKSPLLAIDVLLLHDRTMVERAKALNRTLRQEWPEGFALDTTHVPHITLLQCFVRRADLGAVIGAVEAVLTRYPPRGLELTTTGLFNSPLGTVSATGISMRTGPALARLQRAIATALLPLIQHRGTADAFVGSPRSTTIDWTVAYVDAFLTKSSGVAYQPHVTGGIAPRDLVRRLAAQPFSSFSFKVVGAGIYQLGDVGTARRPLWRAPGSATQ